MFYNLHKYILGLIDFMMKWTTVIFHISVFPQLKTAFILTQFFLIILTLKIALEIVKSRKGL